MRQPPFFMFVDTPIERYRWETFWTKEPETLAWIESFDPHDVFFDIGANVGVYSLYAASLYPEMKIYAFEPMEANYETLHRLRKFNEFTNIIPMRYAIGDRTGICCLRVNDATSGATGAQVEDAGGVPVICETIDSLVEVLPVPTHVKIDIDGQELAVIRGMQNTLPAIKSILVEVSRATIWPMWAILYDAGFRTMNRFNSMTPHSSDRRQAEGIDAENIIFVRAE